MARTTYSAFVGIEARGCLNQIVFTCDEPVPEVKSVKEAYMRVYARDKHPVFPCQTCKGVHNLKEDVKWAMQKMWPGFLKAGVQFGPDEFNVYNAVDNQTKPPGLAS